LGILRFLQLTLEMVKELFGVMHIGEEEVLNAKGMHVGKEKVPNANRMRVGEEEASLSQPITTAVPPEEEEVPVL
jgi:hypothetical protein